MAGTLASLLIKLGIDASDVDKGVAGVEKSIGGLGVNTGQAFKVAAGAIGAGLAIASKGAIEMENRAADFQAATGASAEEAEHFAEKLNALSGQSLVPLEELSKSMTFIRTDLGLTGEAADKAADQFAKYERATGQGADAVLAFDDIQDAWNLTAADTQGIMDTLIAGQQKYGGSIQDSQDILTKLAPVLQAANMEWRDGTELINLFNAAGVDATAGVTGMTKALGKVKSPDELEALLKDIAMTEDPFLRAQKAIDLFGAKAGPKLAQALQASGGDLDQFGFSIEEVTGKTDAAADAMDSTFSRKLQKALEFGKSLIRGFGMEVGPALTGALSGVSFAKSLGLDKALAPVFQKMGLSAGDGLVAGMSSKLSTFAKSGIGNILKTSAAVAIPIALMVEVFIKANELDAQFGEQKKAITDNVQELLKTADLNTVKAQLEATRNGNKDILEQLIPVGEFFLGRDVTTIRDQSIAQMEAYIKAIEGGASRAEAMVAAGFQDVATTAEDGAGAVADGIDKSVPEVTQAYDEMGNAITTGPVAAAAATKARMAGYTVGARWASGVSQAVSDNVSKVQSSVDVINSAMEKGPELVPYKKRLAQFQKASENALRNIRRAVKANDPANAAYWVQQYQNIQTAQSEFKEGSKTVWGDVATIIDANANKAGTKMGQMARNITGKALKAQRGVTKSARQMGRKWATSMDTMVRKTDTAGGKMVGTVEGTIGSIPAKTATYGEHAGENFASNLQGAVPETAAAARNIGAAVARFIAFSAPPREGPLHDIRSWGPHMVEQWAGGTEGALGKVERVAQHFASAASPQFGTPSMAGRWGDRPWDRQGASSGVGGDGGRGDVHIHIGTLIADDRGLDELERRMDKRRRIKSRAHQRYND